MKNVTFNILKAIQNLRDAGFSESQASAIVGMMGDAFGATVTTKADLAALESRVYRFMVVQTGVTVGLIFAALFILIGGFGTFHRESASDAVQGQTSWRCPFHKFDPRSSRSSRPRTEFMSVLRAASR